MMVSKAFKEKLPSDLEVQKCWNCHKEVVVAKVSPCRNNDKLTGIWLTRYDEESQSFPNVGVLCRECAFSGKFDLGFSGGRLKNLENWEAILNIKEASPSPNNAYPFSVGEAKARGLCAADNEVSNCKLCPCWSGGDQGWLDCEEWRDYERKEEASS